MPKLADIAILIVDSEHKTAPTSVDGFPMIRTPNIGPGRFLLDGVLRVDEPTYSSWTKRAQPQEGDLILAREAPVGNVAAVPPGMRPILGQRTVLIRPDHKTVNSRFLQYLMMGPEVQNRMLSAANGATVAHLNMSDIRALSLPTLPPLQTQRKIAAVLAAYDELIENNLRRIEILEELAQAVYREWFVNFRFPDHEDAVLVDSSLGTIPEKWTPTEIGDICARIQSGSTPPRGNAAFWADDGVAWYKTGELQDGFLLGSEECVSETAPVRIFAPGTILMAIYGSPTVGRMGVVVDPSSANQAALGLVAEESKLGVISLFYLLREKRLYFNSIAQGAAQQNISKSKVESTVVLLPDASVSKRFDALVRPGWDLRLNLAKQNANLRATRGLLLPKLVSGEVDVSELDIDTEWLAS